LRAIASANHNGPMDSDLSRFTARPATRTVPIPRSSVPGIGWPAISSGADAVMLALLQQLELSQWSSPETLVALQMRQMELLLAHAAKTCAFYRNRLAMLRGIKPGALTPEHLRNVPLLRRRDLQDEGKSIISSSLPKGHGKPFDVYTSGSTGTPVRLKGTQMTGMFLGTLNMRLHLWHGRGFSATVAAIQVLKDKDRVPDATKKPIAWAPAFGRGGMFRFDISKTVDDQLAWLAKLNPAYLLTYPSNVLALIERSREKGIRLSKLQQVATLGEIVTSEHRDACREHWGVPIVDTYSSQEVGIIALQCPGYDHYLVQAESVYVEVLDDAGMPCPPGSVGRVVVTDLHNFATPLVRYDIGDHAEVGDPCPTGRALPVLTQIMGRTRNMMTLPDGNRKWPALRYGVMAERFDYRQIQLIQRSVDEIVVRLVVDAPFDAAKEEALRAALTDEIGHRFAFPIEYVDDIPKAANGKYEDFRSEVTG